ncbi:hypothetical protein SERLA73DRAFT_182166 [Serpula lacrymans var. lacrymans S7.3]|uniref:Endonuclease/exonuclease/phosphatase domain-containing protein n=2 Tax=Serpula lacrymans var. lacrymans TaxID=341189 RepID=F8PWT0_SERL3|nr:uncharacterized protein SERLADRAFT_468689 [Serpula lacrymans var. lacrymans S7.9]EGN99257.1 hypothetical protein SERLA73DRAFT_182166 [Serpula lacrymans var. lacrymans S7.3]EGO24822.1 hypothetical protein SERLADRAFT_468689 [Serpula lacrymans var. lacrymans S7.9]
MFDLLRPLRTVRFSSKLNRWTQTSNCGKGIRTPLPSSITIISWNVDFSSYNHTERLLAAMAHIQYDVLHCKTINDRPKPCCILLQEVNREVFPVILTHEWIQRCFIVTPTSYDQWPSHSSYGNVTLVSRSIPVSGSWSIDFSNSTMSRNALITDLKLSLPSHTANVVTVRVANTHLESLPMGARARPEQLQLIADALQEEGIHGGVVCGDMNNIGPSDLTITDDAGLADAWIGEEDDEDGYTWGYQPRCEYPPGRLDKILFTPCSGVIVEQPEKVGVNQKVAQGEWVSDHFGLMTTVRVV